MDHNPPVSVLPLPNVLPAVGVALVAAAVAVLAGGAVHLHEWLASYRHIPSMVPGSAVVRIGFPLNTAASLVIAAVLAMCAFRKSSLTPLAIAGAFLFEMVSLASLILSRTGSVFGWNEMVWTPGADRTRLIEIAALTALGIAGAVLGLVRDA